MHLPTHRKAIVGVMGASACDATDYEIARRLGELLALADFILLCGGGTGIMEGAARGATEAGGLTLGIMPGSNQVESPPNPYIQIPIFTGLAHARNAVNVLSCDLIIALTGAFGTLSEIALAAASDKVVILLNSWALTMPEHVDSSLIHHVTSPAQAVELAGKLLDRAVK